MIEDVNNFGVLTSEDEKKFRSDTCSSCEKLTMIENIPTCDACACPISYVIQYKFKICPLLKWNV